MKKILQLTIALLFASTTYGQLIGNIETTFSHKNSQSKYTLGAGLQYLFYYDSYFLPGINAGVMMEIGEKDDIYALSFPVNLQARYYFFGRHSCCGGAYVEPNIGVKFMKYETKSGETYAGKNVLPQVNLGVGYRFPMSFDYNFRIGYILNGSQVERYIGFKFGYTF